MGIKKHGLLGRKWQFGLAYTFVYPIDVLKVQYQCQTVRTPVSGIFSNILKKQGLRGFYKGYGSNLLTYPMFWGVFFESKNHLPFNNLANILLAGSAGSLVTNPLFVVTTRFQTEVLKNRSMSYRNLIPQIYRNEGVGAFFKGYPATIINNSKLCLQMPLADYMANLLTKEGDSDVQRGTVVAGSSAVAKLSTSLLTYPLDLFRNIQRDSETKLPLKTVIKRIYHTSGLTGYYRGLLLYTSVTLPTLS